jgi:phage tail-like protein
MNNYPVPKFHFSVDWGGTRLGFTEVSGLDMATDAIPYREGNAKTYNSVMVPGRQHYTEVVMKRGTFPGDIQFFTEWQQSLLFSEMTALRDVTISLLDDQHQPLMIWKLKNAWPCKLKCTDLNARASEIAIESLTFVHEGVTVSNPIN